MLRHHSVKNAVSADVGSLSLSLSDATLFSWMEILARYYLQVCSVNFKRSAAK